MRNAISLTTAAVRELRIARQGHRMDADVVRDDELRPRQPDAGVRDRRQRERPAWIAHDEHDARAGLGQRGRVEALDVERQRFRIDVPFGAFGTADGDRIPGSHCSRRRSGADDARQPELARHDRRVRGSAALIGDDGGHATHHGLPVGIGALGDEDFARLHLAQQRHVANDAGTADADLLADRLSGGERWTRAGGAAGRSPRPPSATCSNGPFPAGPAR